MKMLLILMLSLSPLAASAASERCEEARQTDGDAAYEASVTCVDGTQPEMIQTAAEARAACSQHGGIASFTPAPCGRQE